MLAQGIRFVAHEKIYVCEECGFKADIMKICCGRRMIEVRHTTKCAGNMCGCGDK